ncbi:MAG: hypothetical protein ACKOAU_01885 [Pirellula sp.]
MNATLVGAARRTVFAGTIAACVFGANTSLSNALLAFDHPAPTDTSTRKGAVACEQSENAESETPSTKSKRTSDVATLKESGQQTNVTLAQWVADWMKNPRRVTAKLAIHGVVPEIELQAVIPASQQKICVNGKCYEVDDKTVEGKPCDDPHASEKASEEEPISEAPVAPPIPPSFPFALQNTDQETSILELQIDGGPYSQGFVAQDMGLRNDPSEDLFGSLAQVQVSVPASTLVAYMVAHAQNTIRLEMTEQLAAERAMYAQRYELLLQHNQQLQTQLAVLEARQLAHTAVDPSMSTTDLAQDKRCQSLTASKEDWDAIQEDLSNIRRQIALLKKSDPVPFASSNIGTEPSNPSRQPQAWRTARSIPYVPVFPAENKSPETTKK